MENIIVGGGPGGINLAIEFTKLNIPFILIERQETFGGQFWSFPRCGELISLNKKNLPESHPGFDYERRYDWHTLSSITYEDSLDDHKLLFTNWSDALFPSSNRYAAYLEYLGNHPKWNINHYTRFSTEVTKICRGSDDKFEIITTNRENGVTKTIISKRIFMATGTSKPVVPNIKGIKEYAQFYGDFEPNNLKIYKGKRVVIIGSGNSAFEIAHALRETVGDMLLLTRSSYRFARQTHNVHDVRSQTSVVYDLAQLKSLVTLSAERITEITKGENGRLNLVTSTPEPHWPIPKWRNRSLQADYVIVCAGFEYTLPDVFTEDVKPTIDGDGKFCMLTSTWESVNIKGLYFVGGSMRANDKFAASGFVHGFRYNVRALAHLISEMAYNNPLKPIFECEVDTNENENFNHISQFMVKLVSSSSSLFELFEYGCSTITIEFQGESNKLKIRVWDTLPLKYVRERWGKDDSLVGRIEVIFQYGFRLYGNDIPSHHFTHPADHFHPEKSAYIHPVFHSYRHSNNNSMEQVDEFHMQESLLARWDQEDYTDPETNTDQYRNVVFNSIAAVLGLSERRSILPVRDQYLDQLYPDMSPKEIEEAFEAEPGLLWISEANNRDDVVKKAASLSLGIK